MAIEKGNVEIVKEILTNDKLDVNIINIFINIYFWNLKYNNLISFLVQFILITFKIKFLNKILIKYLNSIKYNDFNKILYNI